MPISQGQGHLRWMMFVDGENLTLRGQEFNRSKGGLNLESGRFWREDVFVWLPRLTASGVLFAAVVQPGQPERSHSGLTLSPEPVRAYYYVSMAGDEPGLVSLTDDLWNLGFTARVFKKGRKDEKAKAVDIALSRDMLAHAFRDHYDVAVLVAGDGDYLPLVEELKREGKVVVVAFFESTGLNPKLRREADDFVNLEALFLSAWSGFLRGG